MRVLTSRPTVRLAAALLLPVLLLVAGCTPDPDEKAPQCPNALLRPDAATFTRYDGRGTDLTNQVLSGRLVDVKGACKGLLGHDKLAARAHVEMLLTSGPAAKNREADIPYIVAVMKKGQLLDRREYTQHVVFPPNVDAVQVIGHEVPFVFPTHRGLGGQDYSIYFLFALSPQELATNQRALAQRGQ